MRLSPRIQSLILVALIAALEVSSAAAAELPADQRVKILLRVLTYDKNISSRADGGQLRVLVLHGDSGASKAEGDAVMGALGALKGVKVKGLQLAPQKMAWSSGAALGAALGGGKVGAVYVCAGLEGEIGSITGATRGAKVATLAGSESLVQKGVAVGAVDKGGKGQIVVNLSASKSEGMSLDAALLRLAEVLR